MARKKRVTTENRAARINDALGSLEAKAQGYAKDSTSPQVWTRVEARKNLATAAVAFTAAIKAAQRDGRR